MLLDAKGATQWVATDGCNDDLHPVLSVADLTGDGKVELITGKRVFAHNGKDPGGKLPPCLFYFSWNSDAKKFTRHVIEQGHVGTGLQIRTADLNKDGRLDIAVAGKSGTYIMWNQGH